MACAIGMTTAYFALSAMLLAKAASKTRLNRMTVWVFALWSVSVLKDLLLPIFGYHTTPLVKAIFVADGWLLLTYTAFLTEITMPKWVTLPRMALLSLPFAVFTMVYAVFPTADSVFYAYLWFLVVFGITMVTVCYQRAIRYKTYLINNYSDITNRDISHVILIFITSATLYMISWLVISLVNHPLSDLLYYIIGVTTWQSIIQKSKNLEVVEILPMTAENQDTDNKVFSFEAEFNRLIVEEKVYLDPNLTLLSLASYIGTNRTYLSRYLNETQGTCFYEYINHLRVTKMSVPMLEEHPEYTLDYIASKSGFNSISTFQRAFRKYMGMSPGQYRRK